MQAPSVCDNQEVLEESRLEMARLQLAYICAQHQLIHLKANNLSLKSSIKWAEENLHSLISKVSVRNETGFIFKLLLIMK